MTSKQHTMKNIMIFWFTLTLVNIGCGIYIVSKIADILK